MFAKNTNAGASGSGDFEGINILEENVGSAGAVEEAGNQPDAVVRQMKDLEVSDIPSLTEGEMKVINELLAHVKDSIKDSNQGFTFPAETTGVKGKALDNFMKAAVQMALRIIRMENSSLNAELSNKISDVSNSLSTLVVRVDGHDTEIVNADKKAQDALYKIEEIKKKLSEVKLKLETLDLAIKNKVPVDLNDAQMSNIKQKVWKVVAADNAKQRIAKHKLMGCIFNLESTPYDCKLSPRQLFFSILEEANATER